MTALAEILGAAVRHPGSLTATLPAGWMQGRTAYGGLSTVLALEAARATADDLPPLRTAQISFVGPLAGTVTVSAEILRRGRNAAFVRADVRGEAGLGLTATFVFMRAQSSAIDHVAMPAPLALPEARAPRIFGPEGLFVRNFEFLVAPKDAIKGSDHIRWARLADRTGLDPMTELVAIADVLPPGALGLAKTYGPISSMTWLVNLLTPAPATRDGWWLLRSTADYARDGCSSQTMAIWNADGVPIASGMQSVALFI